MNNDNRKSQISAWFDDELSADERAMVDGRLEELADDRDELAEYRQLAEWLSELPSDKLPSSFAAEVIGSARRSLPRNANDNTPRLQSHGGESTHSLKWTQGVGMLLTTAAVLFVAFTLFDGQYLLHDEQRESTLTAQSEIEEGQLLAKAEHGGRLPKDDFADDVDSSRVNEAGKALSRAPMAAAMPSTPRESKSPADQFGGIDGLASRDALAKGLTFRGDLKQAQIGAIVEAMERTANRVSVVRLTVVDRQEGLRKLQLLLSRNHIPRESSAKDLAQLLPESADGEAKSAPQKQDDQLLAVYVKATGDQLTSVLEQIRAEQRFQNVDVERPIAFAELAKATPHRLGGYANSRVRSQAFSAVAAPTGERNKDLPKRPVATNKPDTNLDKKNSENEKSKEGRQQKKQLKSELDRISRQLQLNLTPELFADKGASPQRAGNKPTADAAEEQVDTRRKDNQNRSEKVGDERKRAFQVPLQILFVLDVVPPANKPDSDDGAA